MRTEIGGVALLLGVMGCLTSAAASENAAGAAEKRGLSSIIPGEGSGTPQPDYLLKECTEKPSTGDLRSAMRSVDPAFMLKNFIDWRDNRHIDLTAIKTTLLEGTTQGKLSSAISNYGRMTYHYDPTPNYVGKDRAVFIAEFEGKTYKVVVDLIINKFVDENTPLCPAPELIKVNSKPVSGSSGYNLNSISVTFADLAGGAIKTNRGQTTFYVLHAVDGRVE